MATNQQMGYALVSYQNQSYYGRLHLTAQQSLAVEYTVHGLHMTAYSIKTQHDSIVPQALRYKQPLG